MTKQDIVNVIETHSLDRTDRTILAACKASRKKSARQALVNLMRRLTRQAKG
jgi:hypothetical protein